MLVLAVAWHKSPEQLKAIADKVGRERIMVINGTADTVCTVPLVEILVQGLGGEEMGVTKWTFEGRGHYLPMEERVAFRKLTDMFIAKTEAMRERAGMSSYTKASVCPSCLR